MAVPTPQELFQNVIENYDQAKLTSTIEQTEIEVARYSASTPSSNSYLAYRAQNRLLGTQMDLEVLLARQADLDENLKEKDLHLAKADEYYQAIQIPYSPPI